MVDTKVIGVEDGSLFVLYTDGLVESRDRDISEGLDRLQAAFGEGAPEADLEDLCKTALDGVYSDAKRDDIAVLIAKLRRIPEDHRVCFQLEPEHSAVRHARSLIRDPLKRWGLEDLIDSSELLVSELVTNAIKYANGEVTLRLILEPETPGLRGARLLPRAAPGAPGRQGRGERPRPARGVPDGVPLGRAAHAWRQGRLVRAAGARGGHRGDARGAREPRTEVTPQAVAVS